MLISDWSSDVCSSDLLVHRNIGLPADVWSRHDRDHHLRARTWPHPAGDARPAEGRGSGGGHRKDRKSVVSGKSVSVRVDCGGRHIIKQKKSTHETHKTAVTHKHHKNIPTHLHN